MSTHYAPAPPIELADHDARAHEGSPDVTKWCPTCEERAVPMRSGRCGFCDTPLEQLPGTAPSIAQPVNGEVVNERAELERLAAAANAEHQRAKLAGRDLVEAAIRCGDALLRARKCVEQGRWVAWVTANVEMHLTTAHRYMRIAEYRQEVLRSNVESIEAAIQLVADHPRRGQGPRRYTDADKRDWVALADQIGIKPAAKALGVSPSTIHKWTSPNSPARGKSRASMEVTEDRIELMAAWLVERFGGEEYPERITSQVRVDAAAALMAIFAEKDAVDPTASDAGSCG